MHNLNSHYFVNIKVKFVENITSGRKLCTKNYIRGNKDSEAKLDFLRERIHENYMHQWVIDNMPVTWCYSILESDRPYCTTRFPIGCFVTPEGVQRDACYLSVSENMSHHYIRIMHTMACSTLVISLSLSLSEPSE